MGKRIFRFCIFIMALVITDQISGIVLKKLYKVTKSSTISKIRYTIDSTNQDILIFGS